MSVSGMNHRTLMGDHHSIAFPKSLGIYDRYLYFIDSRYDHLVRVNAEDGSNMEKILENDPDLKSMTVFSKKSSEYFYYLYLKCIKIKQLCFRYIPSMCCDQEWWLSTILYS